MRQAGRRPGWDTRRICNRYDGSDTLAECVPLGRDIYLILYSNLVECYGMEQVEAVVLAAAAVVVIGPGSSKSGNSNRSGVVRRSETIRCQGPIAVCIALREG